MKLFNIREAHGSRRGWILVLECNGEYHGWTDHRGLRLPIGDWIRFIGEDRMVEPYGNGFPYRNGFHAVYNVYPGTCNVQRPDLGLNRAQYRADRWAALKHRKKMNLKELEVSLRDVTHTGEMVFKDHGPDYRGCVAMEMRIDA